MDLADWNASHSKRWNRLRTALRRRYPGLEFCRGVEVQTRGAIHDHAILRSLDQVDVFAVQSLALAAGFGCVLDLAAIEPGSRKAAYYISKYVVKACDSRDATPWRAEVIDYETGEITRELVSARYRAWSCSRQWGKTMTQLRAEAAEWCRATLPDPDADALAVILNVLGDQVVMPEVADPPG